MVFASIREHVSTAIFACMSRDKKFALGAASSKQLTLDEKTDLPKFAS